MSMVTDLSRGRHSAPPAPAAEVSAPRGNRGPMSRVEAEASISGMRRHIDTAKDNLCSANSLYVHFVDREGWKVLGYKSLEECRVARFPWIGERSWWRLEAASRVSQNLGLSDAITVPVDTLESLNRIPTPEQAEVWAEATGGDPGVVPTQRAVRAAVKEHLEKKEESLAKAFADQTEDGTVTRTVVGREPGDDDEDDLPSAADWPADKGYQFSGATADKAAAVRAFKSDEADEPEEASSPEDDFVAGILANEKCAYHDLDDVRRERFVAGAVAWFRLTAARKAYQVQLAEQRNIFEKRCHKAVDPYMEKHGYMIGIKGPSQWRTCAECKGSGRRVVGDTLMSGCAGCNGAGWRI